MALFGLGLGRIQLGEHLLEERLGVLLDLGIDRRDLRETFGDDLRHAGLVIVRGSGLVDGLLPPRLVRVGAVVGRRRGDDFCCRGRLGLFGPLIAVGLYGSPRC